MLESQALVGGATSFSEIHLPGAKSRVFLKAPRNAVGDGPFQDLPYREDEKEGQLGIVKYWKGLAKGW